MPPPPPVVSRNGSDRRRSIIAYLSSKTPSARRFLTKPPAQQSFSSTAATARHGPTDAAAESATPAVASSSGRKRAPRFDSTPNPARPPSSGGQFASTPRFSFARPPSPKRPRTAQEPEHIAPPRRFLTEDIDREIHTSSPLNEDEELSSPSRPVFLAPLSSARRIATDASQPLDALPLHPTRPVFLQPTNSTQDHIEPLPEAFSPHRRGQKFASGGMAAEVRQWILDTSQTSQYARRTGPIAARPWHVQVIAQSGGVNEGAMLVRGQVDGREGRFLLPGAGKTSHDATIRPGTTLAISPPTWEVEVEHEKWVVAPDWHTLS